MVAFCARLVQQKQRSRTRKRHLWFDAI